MLWSGLACSLVGLAGGFGALAIDSDSVAVNLLGLVPIGFMLLFAGIVGILLGKPVGKR